jgi:hypothetical protein
MPLEPFELDDLDHDIAPAGAGGLQATQVTHHHIKYTITAPASPDA